MIASWLKSYKSKLQIWDEYVCLHDFCWFMNLIYLILFPCHLVSHVCVQRPSWRPCWISLKPQRMVKNRGRGNIFCHNFIYSAAISTNEVSKSVTFHSSYFMTNRIMYHGAGVTYKKNLEMSYKKLWDVLKKLWNVKKKLWNVLKKLRNVKKKTLEMS